MTKCEPRRDHCSTPLLAVLAMALIGIAWSTPANAKLKVELSDEVQQTIREMKESPRAWTKRFDSEWNRGLEELGKTDPDAKTLFESEQTIRIVCFGSQEAKDAGLEPDTTGLYGGVAQMRGDFGADGKPTRGGKAILAIECNSLKNLGLTTPINPAVPDSTFRRMLIHELLHAAHRERQHPAGGQGDPLELYERFVENFEKALEDASKRPRPRTAYAPRTGGQMPGVPGLATPRTTPTEFAFAWDQQTTNVSFQAGAGGQVIRLPRRTFLAYEPPGATSPTLGLFTPESTVSGASFSGSFNARFATSALSSLSFRGSFFHAKSDVSQKIATIDPGLGNRLAIAGPLGGATGFGLGFHPLNVVEDAFYEANLRKTGGSVGFGYTTATPISVSIGFYGSAGYSNISFDERFGGSIPGFLRDFAYQSSGRIDQVRLRGGIEVEKAFPLDVRIPRGPAIVAGGFVEVGPDFSRGSGSDRLSFTGFPDSSISLNKQTVDFGLSAGLLLSLRTTGGMKFGIEGRYVRDTGLPVFERNGTDPTTLELKAGDALIGRAFMSVPFAPPPPPPP